MKKIRILTAIICICVITACSQQRDNSTRVIAIEQIAPAEGNDFFVYFRAEESDSDVSEQLIKYNPEDKKEEVLLEIATLKGASLADFVEGKGFIVFSLFQHENTMANGQSLYCMKTEDTEPVLLAETDARYKLYSVEDVILAQDTGDDGVIIINQDTATPDKKGDDTLIRENPEHCSITMDDGLTVDLLSNSGKSSVRYRLPGEEEIRLDSFEEGSLNGAGVFRCCFREDNDVIIGRITETNNSPGFVTPDSVQSYVLRDYLIEIDPRKRADRILYSAENNTERIIGYSDGVVFLYREDRLIKRNVETNETEVCLEGLPRENSLLFVWRGNYLIVFDMDDCAIVGQVGI